MKMDDFSQCVVCGISGNGPFCDDCQNAETDTELEFDDSLDAFLAEIELVSDDVVELDEMYQPDTNDGLVIPTLIEQQLLLDERDNGLPERLTAAFQLGAWQARTGQALEYRPGWIVGGQQRRQCENGYVEALGDIARLERQAER